MMSCKQIASGKPGCGPDPRVVLKSPPITVPSWNATKQVSEFGPYLLSLFEGFRARQQGSHRILVEVNAVILEMASNMVEPARHDVLVAQSF